MTFPDTFGTCLCIRRNSESQKANAASRFSFPSKMVVELDIGIAKSGSWISRSRLIAQAVRAFIDKGGLEKLESHMPPSDTPEEASTTELKS